MIYVIQEAMSNYLNNQVILKIRSGLLYKLLLATFMLSLFIKQDHKRTSFIS